MADSKMGDEGKTEEKVAAGKPLPKMDFNTLILSLSTSTLYNLGIAPDPVTKQTVEPNLEMARQTIDTLEILQEKTRGNLEAEEAKLLESLLYELRLRFVEICK